MSTIFGKNPATAAQISAPVFEGYGIEVNGDLLALQESYEDQLSIIRSIHAMDMEELKARTDVRQLQESGASEEAIAERMNEYEATTESMVKTVWEKVKEFFRNLWGKLRAFFDSVVRYFDAAFRSGEEFAKKYEADLKKLNLDGYEYKMYEYTHLDDEVDEKEIKANADQLLQIAVDAATAAGSASASETLRQALEDRKDKKEERLEEFRGALVGGGSLTAQQFKEKLFAYFRGGATDEKDKKNVKVDINAIIAVLKDVKAKGRVDKLMKKTDEELSGILKKIDEISKKVSAAKADGDEYKASLDSGKTVSYSKDTQQLALEALRILSSEFSAMKDIQLQFFRAWRSAWAERTAVYKMVCLNAFRYKKK